MKLRWRNTLSIIAALFAFQCHAEPVKSQHLTVDLVSDSSSIAPSKDFRLGLHFILDPGWHVYWQNAGDSGQPPEVKWHAPAGMNIGALLFPEPRRLPLGPLMDYGYEGQVLFPVRANYAGPATTSPLPLTADVRWLVCRESCIPGKATLSLVLPVGTATQNAATQELFRNAESQLPTPLPKSASVAVAASDKDFVVTLHDGRREESAEFFPFDPEQIANAAPQRVKPLPDGVRVYVAKADTLQKVPSQLHGLLKLPAAAYEFQSPVAMGAPAAEDERGATVSRGILATAGLAFLGGILLNLMPCVFPVLFLKGLALVSSSGEERKRMRVHGLVYTLGILVSFWAIVVVLLALRAGGSHLGWGFQFQSPGFIAAMAALLFFLGLSLAGQFDVGLSLTSAGGGLAQSGGYAGSFFTGVLATIVATPCTGPFMGAAIGYALAQPAYVTLVIFTALALGLALPYLLLTMRPAWTKLLPKPGVWMEYLKIATAVPIFATVIWLVWLYTVLAGTDALIPLLACFVLLAVAGWVLGRWPAKTAGSVAALVLAVIALALPLSAARRSHVEAKTTVAAGSAWQPYSAAAFAAARSQGKPVFVDFTAQWCLSCQVNERVALGRPDIQARFAKEGVVLFRADWTQQDPEVTSALEALGRNGVPVYALYAANSPQARLLPEVLTPGIVLDALTDLQQHTQAAKGVPR
jgi:thiol:disulfide interchange protein DsbD